MIIIFIYKEATLETKNEKKEKKENHSEWPLRFSFFFFFKKKKKKSSSPMRSFFSHQPIVSMRLKWDSIEVLWPMR